MADDDDLDNQTFVQLMNKWDAQDMSMNTELKKKDLTESINTRANLMFG